jgi:ABC-2 type transport system permease protein
MVNWNSRKLTDILILLNGLVLLVLLNVVSSATFYRFDLTEEKRYSIKPQTKDILRQLDDKIYVEVFLEGDLNAGFRRFRKAIAETLEEFRIYSDNKVEFTFIDPTSAVGQKARNEFMADLASKGIRPTNVIENRNGQKVEKLIFPGVLISYGGAETGVMLLKGNKARKQEEEINESIEGIEFELVNAIHKLTNIDRKLIGVVSGHGELDSLQFVAAKQTMEDMYDVRRVRIADQDLTQFDALIIAKPVRPFEEIEVFKVDQYIMNGGKALFFLDKLEASMDSAVLENYFAFPYNIGLDDLLFKYGIRINPDLIQDQTSAPYPIVTGTAGSRAKMELMTWPYFPLINRYADHAITRNLDAVVTKFVSSMDTVKSPGVKKTPLLFTSQYSKKVTAPVSVSLNELRINPQPGSFNQSFLPVGYLLEGSFQSLYKNRFMPDGATAKIHDRSAETKIIVISDGDILKNDINPRTHQPQMLGFDPFTNYTFANQDLLMNMLAYVTDENGLIRTRNKEVKIRPLDRTKATEEKFKWQFINLVMPILVLIIFGVLRAVYRRRKYSFS